MSIFYDSDGQPITSPAEIANSFNTSRIFDVKLLKQIAPCYRNHREYLKNPVPQSMFLSNVTPDEIVQISRSLKQSHSPAVDQIDPTLAKFSVPMIAHVLAAIINCSFNSGIFPEFYYQINSVGPKNCKSDSST